VLVGVGVNVSVDAAEVTVGVCDAVDVAVGAFEVSVGVLVMDGVKVGPPGVIVSVAVGPPGVIVRVEVDAFDVSVGVLVNVGVDDGPLGDFVREDTGTAVNVRVGFLIVPGGRTTMVKVGKGVEVGKKVGRAVRVSVNAGADVDVKVSVLVAVGALAFLCLNRMPSKIAAPHTNSKRINAMVATCVERLLKLTFIGVEPFLFCTVRQGSPCERMGRRHTLRKIDFAALWNISNINCKTPARQKNSPR
jgi:hypothetical protein